jgi:hypothetical protein
MSDTIFIATLIKMRNRHLENLADLQFVVGQGVDVKHITDSISEPGFFQRRIQQEEDAVAMFDKSIDILRHR